MGVGFNGAHVYLVRSSQCGEPWSALFWEGSIVLGRFRNRMIPALEPIFPGVNSKGGGCTPYGMQYCMQAVQWYMCS